MRHRDIKCRASGILAVPGWILILAVPSLFAASAGPASRSFDEKASADFYRGKTVTIVVGFAPGVGMHDNRQRR
jgi:hypothetical protein